MLTVIAPAKINLTLEVLGERSDGYHEIRSVMQTIDLCDRLVLDTAADISYRSDMAEWDAGKSLVSRAVRLFRDKTGYSGGVSIEVEKRIPLMSGLGGDSSDAAAVLRGLNTLWETDLPQESLREMAQKLGSDVSFFLYGGTALVEGRGELVSPLPSVPPLWFVLAVPPVETLPDKTKKMYESLSTSHFTDGRITSKLMEVIRSGGEFTPSLLFNTFENVAFTRFSGLDVSREHFIKLGATSVHLAGAGSVLFSVVPDKAAAEELCELCNKQNMQAYVAGTFIE